MVRFIEVKPEDIPNLREGRRGRVSYPILKTFLEQNKVLVQLDRTGIQQSMQSLTSCLNSYVTSHGLPVKIFQRAGNLYLMRLDTDDDGQLINRDLTIGGRVRQVDEVVDENEGGLKEVTAEEVASRFSQEKDQVLK